MKLKLSAVIVSIFLSITISHAQNKDSLRDDALRKDRKVDQANLMPGAAMPVIRLQQLDTLMFTTTNANKDKNIILMLFNPSCGHCIDQTKLFIKNMADFNDCQFILSTGENMFEYLPQFAKSVGYTQNTDMIVGVDVDYATTAIFAFEGIPQIMIYDKQRKLVDVFYKDTSIQKIKNALKRLRQKNEQAAEQVPELDNSIDNKAKPKSKKKKTKK
jgi:thiol-disulfide isomerase/thioredoxin